MGGILASDGVLGYDEEVWGDEGNRRQLIADVEGSEPETAGILLAHIDELGQALNQHYRPAQPRFSDDSDQ